VANWLTSLFGSRNQRILNGYNKDVARTNALEETYKALSDEALFAKTQEFRTRLSNGETLDQLLPDAFAAVREASRRSLGMRHFDVQLIGGMTLHQGKIAEMRTGEGKTLMSTLPVYLNALPAKGVHVVTVNEYLAQRDADWIGASVVDAASFNGGANHDYLCRIYEVGTISVRVRLSGIKLKDDWHPSLSNRFLITDLEGA